MCQYGVTPRRLVRRNSGPLTRPAVPLVAVRPDEYPDRAERHANREFFLWLQQLGRELTTEDEAAIRSVITRLIDFWNRHDMHSFAALFSEDADMHPHRLEAIDESAFLLTIGGVTAHTDAAS